MPNKIGVLPFRIGEATDVALSAATVDFYEQVSAYAIGDPVCNVIDREELRTIGVRQSRIRNEEAIYDLATAALRPLATVADYLIVDLANPPRDEFAIDAIIRGVVSALSEVWWAAKSRLALILINQPISQSSFAYARMRPHIQAGQIAVIDRRGLVDGLLPSGAFDHTKYAVSLRAIQDDPMVLLERRMIRRVGHFRHNTRGRGRATKFYFDGYRCKNEIGVVLNNLPELRGSKQLLVHAPVSPWLTDVAKAYCIDHKVKLIDLGPYLYGKPGASSELDNLIHSKPHVLVPMIDTGRTLQRIHEFLLKRNPQCKPVYLSIMSTGADDSEKRTRMVATKDGGITVHYLMKVNQQDFDAGSEPKSVREHAGSNFDINKEPIKLTSYAFWEMISETGFKEEEDVPNTRKSLGYVPRFPEVLEKNGPLIAHKIEKLLSPLPLDIVLICADEAGARALINCIRSLIICSAVRVPRPVIDGIPLTGDLGELHDQLRLRFGSDEWFKRLMSASSGATTQAMLIDEFSSRGETFVRLSRLCASVRLAVSRSVALVDFGTEEIPRTHPTDCLYRLPLGGIR